MNTEAIRDYCLSFNAVTEEVKWENDLCFLIYGKMFCIFCLEPPFKVSFKTTASGFEELCNRNGIIPAPYLARYHWVQVLDENALTEKEWKNFISLSFELISSALKKKSSTGKK